MSIDHRQMLIRSLENWHAQYNPAVRMVRQPFRTPGYHSTLTNVEYTHPTRAALDYALALLDSGLPEYEQRAFGIIEKVIRLQDQNPEHHTYGIWPWFLEEPLEQMSPPDWNWADFCGKRLVLTELRHADRLPSSLREQIRKSVFCACDAIIKRNVGPGYTNIAIMGALVTLLAGEIYEHAPYAEYGLDRLRRFRDYTYELGTFQEYNSPTYTVIAIQELAAVRAMSRTPEARRIAAEMLDVAWKMIAAHYHAPSGQWSGPHSRSYSTLLNIGAISFLHLATNGAVALPENAEFAYNVEWYGCGEEIRCPEQYLSAFTEAREMSVRQTVHRPDYGGVLNEATTYMNETFSLGTFSKDVMWNQRRNLIAYMPGGKSAAYASLRFLHDGYDYSSAVFTCRQHQSAALFGLNFCTNGGDTHIGLDPIDGFIEAEDLRLRLEIGGGLEQVSLPSDLPEHAETVTLRIANLKITLQKLFAAFGDERTYWEIQREADVIGIDYVVYSGARKKVDFRKMRQALLVFAFHLQSCTDPHSGVAVGSAGASASSPEQLAASAKLLEDHVIAKYRCGNHLLSLTLPTAPAEKQALMQM